MANGNKLIQIPLNGVLNLNKLKTFVRPFEGYNNLNSPIYGNTLAPLYVSENDAYGRPQVSYDGNKIKVTIDENNNTEITPDFFLKKEKVKLSEIINENNIIAMYSPSVYTYSISGTIYCKTEAGLVAITDEEEFCKLRYLRDGTLVILTSKHDIAKTTYNVYRLGKSDTALASLFKSETTTEIDNSGYKKNVVPGMNIYIKEDYSELLISIYEDTYNVESATSKKIVAKDTPIFDRKKKTYEFFTTRKVNLTDWTVKEIPLVFENPNDSSNTIDLYFKGYVVQNGVGSFNSIPIRPAGFSQLLAAKELKGPYNNLTIVFYNDCKIEAEAVSLNKESIHILSGNTKAGEKEQEKKESIDLKWKYCLFDSTTNGFWLESSLINKCLSYQNGYCTTMVSYSSAINTEKTISTIRDTNKVVRAIYNRGYLVNVSIAKDKDHVGTILAIDAAIDAVSDPVYNDITKEVYFNIDKTGWYKIALLDSIPKNEDISDYFDYLGNDLIIFKTSNNNNGIYQKDLRETHIGSDWNNRLYSLDNTYYTPKLTKIGSGCNLNYNIEEGIVCSSNATYGGISFSDGIVEENPVKATAYKDIIPIDIYKSETEDIDVKYFISVIGDKQFLNQALVGLSLPLEPTLIPSPLSTLIFTDFNQIFLKEGRIFYTLASFNSVVFLSAFSGVGSVITDIENMFIVQGNIYTINREYIFPTTYQNSVYTVYYASCRIAGMKYCGCLPDMAIFYSPMDKTLKKFTADNNLSTLSYASDIEDIYMTKYIPENESIMICTDKGIIVYNKINQYILPITNVSDIYSKGDKVYIEYKDLESETPRTVSKAFKVTPEVGFKKIPVKIETGYYGAGDNKLLSINSIQFRVYSEDHDTTNIKLKVRTITDEITTSEEKTLIIPNSEWDEITNTCFFKYHPKYQRCAGMSVYIESDCAISDIVFDTTSWDGTTIAKPSLNI